MSGGDVMASVLEVMRGQRGGLDLWVAGRACEVREEKERWGIGLGGCGRDGQAGARRYKRRTGTGDGGKGKVGGEWERGEVRERMDRLGREVWKGYYRRRRHGKDEWGGLERVGFKTGGNEKRGKGEENGVE